MLLSHISRVRLCATPWRQPTRVSHPWDSPGKNTGVSCHFLLQCMRVKSESEITQLCPSLSDPMDCSLPGFSIHGIFQARVLEWVASAFSNSRFISGCYYCLVLLQGVSLSFEHSTLTKKTEKQKKFSGLVTGDKSNANSDFTQTCQLI